MSSGEEYGAGFTARPIRRRRSHRRYAPVLHEERLVDVPIATEGSVEGSPPSPAPSASVPTFEYGSTLADPAVVWAILRTLSIQHDVLAALGGHMGVEVPPVPFQLGPDPDPSTPWSYFPEPTAEPPVQTDAAGSPQSSGHSLTEQLMAIFAMPSPSSTPALGAVEQPWALVEESLPSPTSVLDPALHLDSDDFLDDFLV